MTQPTSDLPSRHPIDSGGSFAFENWRAANEGAEAGDALEYPLYSDARLTGESNYGPYSILNAIADTRAQAALVLRAAAHVRWSYADMSETDVSRYHGGNDSDEITCLLALAMGCRLKAGDPNRYFQARGDPRGRPWSFRSTGRADPIPPAASRVGALIPSLLTERNVNSAGAQMLAFFRLAPQKSVVVVKAARLYQEAVWMVDSDPALAWLLLVSAIETAADYWRGANMLPREKLHSSKPDLERMLVAAGGESLADDVATMIADSLGATSKFIKFCMTFLPTAPAVRPEISEARLPWESRGKMREALGLVYHYRSLALHAGIPVPAPMCTSAFSQNASMERPPFGSMGSFGGIWRRDDIPMLIHVFEYIVRNCLIKWWMEDADQPRA